MTQLNRALAGAIAARTKAEHLARRVRAVEADLTAMRTKLSQLKRDLAREEQDVQRLKEGGLLGLWYDLVGKRERQLAKEEEEAALARLQYAEALQQIEELEGERAELNASLGALSGPGSQVEGLLAEKRRLIRLQYPQAADRLLAFDAEERSLQGLQTELSEAQAAGSRAAASLEGMAGSLESARKLGVWDAWTRGGILVDLAKHKRLDEAEGWAAEVHETLRIFQRELRDVDAALHAPSIGISGWDRTVDIWFDNIFTDWSILKRIEGAAEHVQQTAYELDRVRDQLRRRMADTTAKLEQLRVARDSFIASFGQA